MKKILKKYLGHHGTYILTEALEAISGDYKCIKKFRWIHFYWMRVVSNYLDSIMWYLRKEKIISKNAESYIEILSRDGYAILPEIELEALNFIEFNDDNSRTESHHKVDNKKALDFAKKMNFQKIAEKYLGVSTCNFYSRSWRLNPLPDNKTKHGNLEWHRDRDGFRELKFFIYLSNVEQGCGEHSIAIGSHNKKLLQFVPQRRYSEEEVLSKFSIVKIFGKAGYCFVEDTSCLHKGSYPMSASRELIMFMFSTGPIYWNRDTIQINL
jgi:hypothetical protein